MFSGLLGSLIGFGMILLSPGQSTRLSEAGGFGSIITLFKRLCFISFNLFAYITSLLILLVFCLILYFCYFKSNIDFKKLNKFVIYFLGASVSIYCMIAAPFFPDRVWSGCIIILTIAIGNIYSLIDWNSINLTRYCNIFLVIICFLNFGSNYMNGFFELKNIKYKSDLRIVYIKHEKSKGHLDICIESISSNNRYSCFDLEGDLNKDNKVWTNTTIARYYGLNTVSMKKE